MEQKRAMLFVFLCLVILLSGFVIVESASGGSGVDSNNDGVVSLSELVNYIQKWINGEVSLNGLTGAIQGWISGGTSTSGGESGGAGGSGSGGGSGGSDGGGGGNGGAGSSGGGNESEGNFSSSGIELKCSDFSKCGDVCCGMNEECRNGGCIYSPDNFSSYTTSLTKKKCIDSDVSEICNNFIDDDGDGNMDWRDSDCQPSIMSTMILGRSDAYNTGSTKGIFSFDTTKHAVINDFCWDRQTRDENGVPIPNKYGFGSYLIEGRCTSGSQVYYEEIPCDGLCINGKCEDDEKITCTDFGELKFEPISSPWGDITFINQLPSEIDVSNISDEEIGKLEGVIKHIAMNSVNLMTRGRYVGYVEKEDDESYAIEFIIDEDIPRDEDCVMGFFEDIIADGGLKLTW